MGRVAGYTAADYLIQHASRERRYAFVPARTWDAVLSHIRDPDDTPGSRTALTTGCYTATPSRLPRAADVATARRPATDHCLSSAAI